MKMQSLYDLLEASQDFCALFEDVENEAQLVSRLERLKRLDVGGMLEDLDSLRAATSNVLEENIELGGPLGGVDSINDILSQIEEGNDEIPEDQTLTATNTPVTEQEQLITNQEKTD